MNYFDFFVDSKEDYLYLELQKMQESMDRRTKNLFIRVSELEEEIVQMREKNEYTRLSC